MRADVGLGHLSSHPDNKELLSLELLGGCFRPQLWLQDLMGVCPILAGADGGLWELQATPSRQAGLRALRSPCAHLAASACLLQVSSPSLETEAVTAVPAPPGLQAAVPALLLCPPHQPGSPRRWLWFARLPNRPRLPRAACSPRRLRCPT